MVKDPYSRCKLTRQFFNLAQRKTISAGIGSDLQGDLVGVTLVTGSSQDSSAVVALGTLLARRETVLGKLTAATLTLNMKLV